MIVSYRRDPSCRFYTISCLLIRYSYLLIQRRALHISGLTPSITSNDLLSRFQSFGKVISFDGFGEHDVNGHKRKFAFVTLEGSVENIRKCECKISHKY